MSADFELTMYPASEGDAAILAWGEDGQRHHALVDLGRTKDYRALRPKLMEIGGFELFVITHVDADHIEGAMPLVREATPPFEPAEVWFNAYHHLIEARDRKPSKYETFSAGQGEKLSKGILDFRWRDRWNKSFGGGAASLETPAARAPIGLAGGLSITLLSPSDEKLTVLETRWLKELDKAKLRPLDPDLVQEDSPGRERFGSPDVEALARVPFDEDAAAANGSTIAFIAGYAGRTVMMLGDAHPGLVAASLERLGATAAKPMPIDCCKISHHGSMANTSPEMLELIDCRRYAFSTDGTKHGHPHPETVARILKAEEKRRAKEPDRPDTELIFNFRQPGTVCWDNAAPKTRYRYACVFPPDGQAGVSIAI